MVFNAVPITDHEWLGKPHPIGLYRARVEVPPRLVNSGQHSIELLAVHDQARVMYSLAEALVFEVSEVAEPELAWFGRLPGAVRPRLMWMTQYLSERKVP